MVGAGRWPGVGTRRERSSVAMARSRRRVGENHDMARARWVRADHGMMKHDVYVNVNPGPARPTAAAPAATQRAHRHDRSFRGNQGAGRLPAGAQGAFRHRRQPVRRPRRGHQHHAPHPADHGRRGHPPRPQPLGGRGRDGGAAGRRAGHRRQQLPGRPRRVLQVHGRPAQEPRRCAHPGLRRRRRRHRAGRDPRAAGLRRDTHLQPRGRAAHGPGRHDRRDGDAL